MTRPDRAQCPHCPPGRRPVKVTKRGLLRVHGPVHARCWGSTLDTLGWVPVPTRDGLVLVEPDR